MGARGGQNRCLTYVTVPHDGVGWVHICVSLLEKFPADVLAPSIVLPRAFCAISPPVHVRQAIPYPIPYRYGASFARPAVNFWFKQSLRAANPRTTIAYFWPTAPLWLIRYAKQLGFLTVREMINTHRQTARAILDEAYGRLGLPADHGITPESVALENEELSLHDYIVAPGPRIAQSLIDAGLARDRILRSSYGWSPDSFAAAVGESGRTTFRALFIGAVGVRKGIPQLLAAWQKSGVDGELVVVGNVEPPVEPLIAPYREHPGIRFVDYNVNLGPFYRSADVFVFPSLEEGDPLVTYQAAGCGLPLIATPMGGANVIRNGVNGLLVEPYDVDGLAQAIRTLAGSPTLRSQFARQAGTDAQEYTIEKIGMQRASLLSDILSRHR